MNFIESNVKEKVAFGGLYFIGLLISMAFLCAVAWLISGLI